MVVTQVSLFYNWGENPIYVLRAFGHLTMSSSSLSSSALTNILILGMMASFFGFKHQSSLIMIKSRTETFQLSDEEAKVLRAMDAVAKKTSAENKKDDILVSFFAKHITKAVSRAGASSKIGASGESEP